MVCWPIKSEEVKSIMCLAIPAEITEILDAQRAIVNVGGVKKEISIALIKNATVGDYVVMHVGYALTKLNEIEAHKTLALFNEMLGGDAPL